MRRCECFFRDEWPALFDAPTEPWARYYAQPPRPAPSERATQHAAERRCKQGELSRALSALVRTGSFPLYNPDVQARLRELTPPRVSKATAAAAMRWRGSCHLRISILFLSLISIPSRFARCALELARFDSKIGRRSPFGAVCSIAELPSLLGGLVCGSAGVNRA